MDLRRSEPAGGQIASSWPGSPARGSRSGRPCVCSRRCRTPGSPSRRSEDPAAPRARSWPSPPNPVDLVDHGHGPAEWPRRGGHVGPRPRRWSRPDEVRGMTRCYALVMSNCRCMAATGHPLPYVLREQQNRPRWALVTGRTSFRTDGLGPLPGPSVGPFCDRHRGGQAMSATTSGRKAPTSDTDPKERLATTARQAADTVAGVAGEMAARFPEAASTTREAIRGEPRLPGSQPYGEGGLRGDIEGRRRGVTRLRRRPPPWAGPPSSVIARLRGRCSSVPSTRSADVDDARRAAARRRRRPVQQH